MSRDGPSPLTEDTVELLRASLETINEDGTMRPAETELTDGIYVGTYPSTEEVEHGVLYVYIADPAYYLHGPAPSTLQGAPQELKRLSDGLRAIMYDTLGRDYQLECRSDNQTGGMYYAASIVDETATPPRYEDSSESA